MKTTFAVVSAFLAATVSAHMQLSNPYPIRSPLNPNGDESKKDYSYTSPLDASGDNFPCKGYQNDPFQSVATYKAGSSYTMSLEGSATHGGGSCQLSLSYDTAKTFTVIDSMEGGCPLTPTYPFTIPADAPSGQALFVWTWFNLIGNREMYMNCAQVTIEGSSSKRSHARDLQIARAAEADVPFSSRPPIFIANVNGPGGCTTVENVVVKFPDAGPDVSVNGSVPGPGYTCTGTAPFLNPSASSGASSGGSSSGGSSLAAASGSTPTSVSSFSAASSPAVVPTSSVGVQGSAPTSSVVSIPTIPSASSPAIPSSSSAAPGGGSTGASCSTEGQIVCGAGGATWSMCSQGHLISMGSVASGTVCQNGNITPKTSKL